jgi:hypothetical protein
MGGVASTQTGPFTSAIIEAQRYFDVTGKTFPMIEYLNTDLARSLNWGIKEIADWLLDSDIHFILNHIHQGKAKFDNNQRAYKSISSDFVLLCLQGLNL